MALRSSIREPVWCVISMDPAIDKEHKSYNWDKYAETFDRQYLPMKEGIQPTEFLIAPVTRRVFNRNFAMGQIPTLEQLSEFVAYGLQDVRNFSHNGEPLTIGREDAELGKRLKPAVHDALGHPKLTIELGMAIFGLSQVPLS